MQEAAICHSLMKTRKQDLPQIARGHRKRMNSVSPEACIFPYIEQERAIFPGGSDGKESVCNVGDTGSIPRSGKSPGEGNGNPLLYSCLGNLTAEGIPLSLVDYSLQSHRELDPTEHNSKNHISRSDIIHSNSQLNVLNYLYDFTLYSLTLLIDIY